MPTYDYECTSCGKVFEVFQQMSDEPLKVCPECGKELRRLVGGGLGVIFKGSGFYVTDSKKGGGSSAPVSGKKPEKTQSESSSGGSKSGSSDTPAVTAAEKK